MDETSSRVAFKITAAYLLFSLIWILFADRVLLVVTADLQMTDNLQALKSWLFALLSAAGIYVVLSRSSRRIEADSEDSCRDQEALARSDDRYRKTLESAGIGLWEWNVEKDQVFWSDRMYELWGYARGGFDGTVDGVARRIHPDDRAAWREGVQACLEQGTDHRVEMRICLPDDRVRWVEAIGGAQLGASGATEAMLGIVIDITERRLALERAERHKSGLAAFIKSASDFVAYRLRMEPQSQHLAEVEFVTPSIEQVMGVRADAPFAEWFATVHPDQRARVAQASEASAREVETFSEVMQIWHPGRSEWRWIKAVSHPVSSASGDLLSFNGVIVDVTEQHAIEARLVRSEQRFRDLVESTSDWIWEVDATGIYTYVSPKVEEVLGYAPRELIGKTPFDMMPADEAARIGRAFADIITSRQAFSGLQNVNRHRHGDQRVMETSGVPVFGTDGEFLGYRGIDRDITELQRADRAVRESEMRYRAVFDQQFQFMAMLSPDGTTLEINELPLKLTGARRDDYLGKPFWQGPAWRDRPEWHRIWPERIAEAMRERRPVFTKDVYCGADGSLRHADAATMAIRDADGQVSFILVQATDTTDRVQAEIERDRLLAELRTLNERLDQKVRDRTSALLVANQELASFAYAVSHDLRAPIRAIHGFEQALREDFGDQLPAEAHGYLDEIRTGAGRMNALIDGLLELSRSTRGELERTRVDLALIARELLEQFRREDPARHVDLLLAESLVVQADERLMRTLMQNLLQNAWKYTAGRAPGEIRIERLIVDRDAYICVQDNGVGFNPEFGHRLFEPFQRLHRQDEFPGIGIGLATASRVVRRHGGSIAACGRPGVGSRFCFTLSG